MGLVLWRLVWWIQWPFMRGLCPFSLRKKIPAKKGGVNYEVRFAWSWVDLATPVDLERRAVAYWGSFIQVKLYKPSKDPHERHQNVLACVEEFICIPKRARRFQSIGIVCARWDQHEEDRLFRMEEPLKTCYADCLRIPTCRR